MNNFAIEVVNRKAQKEFEHLSCYGRITIDTFQEGFVMPITSWSLKDYERQWKEGLSRIKTHETSCLVTRVYCLNTEPLIEFWLLYKVPHKVHIYNRLLVQEIATEIELPYALTEFDHENCYQAIMSREIEEERAPKKNDPVWEWDIEYSAIERFCDLLTFKSSEAF